MVRPDLAVFSPDHTLQLVVEVKGRSGSSREWAAKVRRNMLAHQALPSSPYFLLVLPDHTYLWQGENRQAESPPDYDVETRSILDRYANLVDGNLSGESLELAVHSWLDALTNGRQGTPQESFASNWLTESGLMEKIRRGSIEAEPEL